VESVENSKSPNEFSTLSTALGNPAKSMPDFPHFAQRRRRLVPDTTFKLLPSVAEYAGLLERHGLEVQEASLFERPTVLEEGERGLENFIRVFRKTFLEKMGEENAQRWIQEVERQCRAELFHDGSWELDYCRLRIAAWKV
jgi:hypothetical protein